ncbi:hypothetical protein [Candidatus Poriferisocius sp.]|uniref:hypothetical protein n=1 Tax=Candidatus Poriferisocius sp. TaxID=3101276 RepID=UPI003B5186E9
MSDAVTLLLILPGLLLAMVFADAAGDRGTASYRASNYAVLAADHAADQIAADPLNAALWAQTAQAVEANGRLSVWGDCVQSDPRFDIGLHAQPEPPAPPSSVAVLVVCPIHTSAVLADDTVTAMSVRRIR